MKLAVCVPVSWEFVPTPFLISFVRLFGPSNLKAMNTKGVERCFHLFNRAFPLDYNRNTLVTKALELEADWLLFLDADMTFPPSLVPALIEDSLQSGAAIVSACYFKKRPPHAPVSSLLKTPGDPQLLTPIETSYKGLVESDVVGMGAALIHAAVFEEISRPWFEYEIYRKTGERTVTEDVPFCRRAKRAGFSILTDTRLICGHIRHAEVVEHDWLEYKRQFSEPGDQGAEAEAGREEGG